MSAVAIDDIGGQTCGSLTAQSRSPRCRSMWTWLCVCGRTINAQARRVREGLLRECSTCSHERRRVMREETAKNCASRVARAPRPTSVTGVSDPNLAKRRAERNIWQGMLNRCALPCPSNVACYGARGISVCDRWRESFANFLSDMGRRPTLKHSIDRIDVSGNYEPSNCRWATPKEQGRNKRNNHMIAHNGETKCVAEWAEILGVKARTIRDRLARGWSADAALTTPIEARTV